MLMFDRFFNFIFYIALVSALERTRCALVAEDAESKVMNVWLISDDGTSRVCHIRYQVIIQGKECPSVITRRTVQM